MLRIVSVYTGKVDTCFQSYTSALAVREGIYSMIDITFDFRSDSKDKNPDTYSPTLNAYHRALWSKELPNGELMELQSKGAPFVLTWKDFYFTSDTMIVEMRSQKNIKIINQAL